MAIGTLRLRLASQLLPTIRSGHKALEQLTTQHYVVRPRNNHVLCGQSPQDKDTCRFNQWTHLGLLSMLRDSNVLKKGF